MLLDLSYHWLAMLMVFVYSIVFLVFAGFWMTIRLSCSFGEGTTFLDALYFSIETMMTIGAWLWSGDVFIVRWDVWCAQILLALSYG